MTFQVDVENDLRYVTYLDHGFVGLIDSMGDDAAIDAAARTSYGSGTRSKRDIRGLIRHLVRNHHTSPLEMVELKFHLKMPIFVARQHVRHRTASINEYSGRYSVMNDEMYMPDLHRFQKQDTRNKQGSSGYVGDELAEAMAEDMSNTNLVAYENYRDSLDAGLSREVARIQLPLSTYTEMYWKIDLKNFFNYVMLRADRKHAQSEIADLAESMYLLAKDVVPVACEAFEDYWMNSETFSANEMHLIRRIINREQFTGIENDLRTEFGLGDKYGMTVNEVREFKEKIGLGN